MKKLIVLLIAVTLVLSGCNRNKDLENDLVEKNTLIDTLRAELAMSMDSNNELKNKITQLEGEAKTLSDRVDKVILLNDSFKEYIKELEETLNEKGDSGDTEPPTPEYGVFFYHSTNGIVSSFIAPKTFDTYITLNILGYPDPDEKQWETLDVSGDEAPTIAFNISGKLFNLRIENIEWNDEMTDYEVLNEICHYEVVENSTILFDSMLAEGLPGELLTWENEEGEVFYYLIHDTTLRGDVKTFMIISGLTDLTPWWKQ